MRAQRHGKQSVVALGLLLALLFDLEDADDAAGKHKARQGRRIVYHHDVKWVAVLGFGGWDKSPVMRIGQSGEKRFGKRECLELGIIAELRTAATGRLDHHAHV